VTQISDGYMREQLRRTQPYTVVILHRGPRRGDEGADAIIWEHGRRNFALRDEGSLPLIFPINDGSGMAGVGVFVHDEERTRQIMDGDPAVQAGVLTYETHPTISFPGSSLP
jgi:hypothetical protein